MEDLLEVEVPAVAADLRVVRLVTLDAAERAGLDCDAADDLRIAVEELCAAAITTAPHGAPAGTLALRYRVTEGSVIIHGIARVGEGRTELGLSRVATAILAVVADHVELDDSETVIRFDVVKHRVVLEAAAT